MRLRNLAALAASMLMTASAFAKPVIVVKEMDLNHGGKLYWNGRNDAYCDCLPNGNDCTMKITISGIAVKDNGNVWHIEGDIDKCHAFIDPAEGDDFDVELNHAGYTLPQGSIHILADDFEGIPAMELWLTGIVADSKGHISADIRK
jgi:hypothetical protein